MTSEDALVRLGENTSEACLGASQVQALQAGTIGLAEAFAGLAGEPHFTQRRAQ